MVKQRARRGEPPLPTATVVIRGDLLDPELSAESARRNFDVYGFYGGPQLAELVARMLRTEHREVPNPHHRVGG
jgi:hypothetical protein